MPLKHTLEYSDRSKESITVIRKIYENCVGGWYIYVSFGIWRVDDTEKPFVARLREM